MTEKKNNFWNSVWNKRMLICIFTGFTSGLPLYILISLLPAWMRYEGLSLKNIGLFALIGIPYTWKFLWAPAMDKFVLPFLGRRRGWMLISQILLLISIASFGFFNPKDSLTEIAIIALFVAFFSASQDIVIDAYRRELLPDNELGFGNSVHVNAYRVSALIPGSLALILADTMKWSSVFLIVSFFMGVGIILTLSIKEPEILIKPRTLTEALIEPFKEFIGRKGWKSALLILAFMFLYKIGDNMATALSTPFYIDMGFSLSEIGLIAKNASLWPSIIGGIFGGLLMIKIGINRALWLFGFIQIITILGFAVLAKAGNDTVILAIVISMEYLGVGLGTAAFVAFIAKSTHPKYTATQLALFTAFASLPRTLANSIVGFIVEYVGWYHFFIICTILAIPGIILLYWVAPWNEKKLKKLY